MSYSMSIYGHGNAETAKAAKKAFGEAVRVIAAATPETGTIAGTLSGSEDGQSFSLSADQVKNGDPVEDAPHD